MRCCVYDLPPPTTSPGETCQHWMHYGEATKAREGWAQVLLDDFKANVEMLKNAVKDQQSLGSPPHGSPQHGMLLLPQMPFS